MFDGGNGADSAVEEKSVARGLIIDPGGGASTRARVHTCMAEKGKFSIPRSNKIQEEKLLKCTQQRSGGAVTP